MKAKLAIAAALLVFSALPAAAQRVISPGMTPDQVRGTFGAPARTRGEGDWSYWFYSNGCPNRCGSDDVVFFRDDRVVAAVLRTRARRISSGPAADALEQAGGNAGSQAIRLNAAPANAMDDHGVGNGRAPERIFVKGRSRDRNGEPTDDSPPARVGGVSVESGAQGQVRDVVAPPARSGSDQAQGQSTVIRTGNGQLSPPGGAMTGGQGGGLSRTPTGSQSPNGRTVTGPGPVTQGAQPPVQLTDSTSRRATSVDDTRAERESQVTRTTVTNQPDSIQAKRRDRENSVTPRVVPRP
ncbi:MAG TPA: hypothetical protein VFJ82_02995 [Longimicrobium sp.]|nr:hypothetical protein [Longimicrobium sp.]